MKLIPALYALLLLPSCSTSPFGSAAHLDQTVGIYDQKQRLRLTFELPSEFNVAETIGCESPLKLNGVLSCGAHAEGSPIAAGYFRGSKCGLIVSGWINTLDPIRGPDEILRSFMLEGKVNIISQKMTKINEHEASLADLDVTFMKPESVNRHERWVMFKVDKMAGALTFKEYAGNEIKPKDLDKFGVYPTQGVPFEKWELDSVIEDIVKSARLYPPNE